MLNVGDVSNIQPQVNATTESAFTADGSTRAILRPVRGKTDCLHYELRLVVRVTAYQDFTPQVYWNSGVNTDLTTFSGDSKLTNLLAGFMSSSPPWKTVWFVVMNIFWESVSQRLIGAYASAYEPSANAWVAPTFVTLNATPTLTDISQMQFFATGKFASSNAGNTASVSEFALEQM